MTFLWREPPCGSNPAVKNCSAAEFLAAYMIAEGAQHVCVCVDAGWVRQLFGMFKMPKPHACEASFNMLFHVVPSCCAF